MGVTVLKIVAVTDTLNANRKTWTPSGHDQLTRQPATLTTENWMGCGASKKPKVAGEKWTNGSSKPVPRKTAFDKPAKTEKDAGKQNPQPEKKNPSRPPSAKGTTRPPSAKGTPSASSAASTPNSPQTSKRELPPLNVPEQSKYKTQEDNVLQLPQPIKKTDSMADLKLPSIERLKPVAFEIDLSDQKEPHKKRKKNSVQARLEGYVDWVDQVRPGSAAEVQRKLEIAEERRLVYVHLYQYLNEEQKHKREIVRAASKKSEVVANRRERLRMLETKKEQELRRRLTERNRQVSSNRSLQEIEIKRRAELEAKRLQEVQEKAKKRKEEMLQLAEQNKENTIANGQPILVPASGVES